MKILIVSQHYAPEPFRISDICETLSSMGHEITVVTDVPNYPDGYIYKEYKHKKKREEVINGVTVHRTFTIGRRKNIIFRFLNYYSWRFSAGHYLKKTKEDFDIVISYQTSPVMMAQPGIDYAKLHSKKLIIYCLDIWPACLKAGGISGGPVFNYYKDLSKKIYSSADKLLVSSTNFKDYLINELGVDSVEIDHLPQYAEGIFDTVTTPKNTDGYKDIVFAGNIGQAQSLDTVLDAAALTSDLDLRWHIVGDGTDLERLRSIAEEKKLDKVIFHGRQPLEKMPEYYSLADAMLLTLCEDEVISLTLPGKVQTYMAAKKPIIAAANGESKRVVDSAKCGYCTPAGNAEMLADSVRTFCSLSNEDVSQLGENALRYYESHFSKERFFNKLLATIEECLSEHKNDTTKTELKSEIENEK